MLISRDLLNILQKHVSPAQLCLIRVMGSDNEYVLRVRYADVHLDYPLRMEGMAPKPQGISWEEVVKALTVMGKMVIPPGETLAYDSWIFGEPAVLAPMHDKEFRFGKW